MDPAKYFQRLYASHVDDCRAAGICPPSPAAWVQLLDEHIRQAVADRPPENVTCGRPRRAKPGDGGRTGD